MAKSNTTACVGCHGQVWNRSPRLEPVREAFFAEGPLPWVKVHDLPDFVYFDHSIHLAKGVGCISCHGRVDQMAAVYQAAPLTMSWCLECHRHPERFVRPKDQVYNIAYEAPANQDELGRELVKKYGIETQVTCSTCHR